MNWPKPFFSFPQNEYVNMITFCKQKKSKSNDPLGFSNQTPDSKRIRKSIEDCIPLWVDFLWTVSQIIS